MSITRVRTALIAVFAAAIVLFGAYAVIGAGMGSIETRHLPNGNTIVEHDLGNPFMVELGLTPKSAEAHFYKYCGHGRRTHSHDGGIHKYVQTFQYSFRGGGLHWHHVENYQFDGHVYNLHYVNYSCAFH